MFTTFEHCAFEIPGLLLGEGQRAWKLVFRELALPWFYVSYRIRDRDVELEETVCIDLLDSLLELEREQNTCRIAITQVQLVSPGWLNGSGRWKMEPLKEVLRGNGPPPHNQRVQIYVLESGDRYLSPTEPSTERELRDTRQVFPAAAAT